MRIYVAMLLGLAAATAAMATPWFTQDPRTLPEDKWRIEEHVLFSEVDSALVDGDKVPLPAGKFSSLTAHTRIRYGVEDDLTVFLDVPWVRKRWTAPSGDVTTADGLGDMMFLAKGKYYDNKAERSRRAWAVSLKTHTGDARGLAAPLSQGSGTTDFSLIHLWEKGVGETTWYGSLGYTLTGDRPDLDRDPGDVTMFNLAAEHKLNPNWNFVWELNGRYEGNTEDASGFVANTGSTTVSFSPGFQYNRPKPGGKLLTLEAGVQVPVIKHGDAQAIQDYTAYVGGYTVF